MRESGWRIISRQKLGAIVSATPRQEGESLEAWGKRLKRAIAGGYPFIERSSFAYQCWLSERRRLLYGLKLSDPPKKDPPRNKRRQVVQQASLEGQLNLFTPPQGTVKTRPEFNPLSQE